MWRVSSILSLNGLSAPPFGAKVEHTIRGTSIHAANEALAHGYEPVIERPEYEPYVDGLRQWYKDYSPMIAATERRVVSQALQLTGRIDLFPIIESVPYVVDVKTGGKAQWHGIQLAGYHALALHEDIVWTLFGPPYNAWTFGERSSGLKRACLYLPGNGKYQWRDKQDYQDEYLFRAALALTRYRHAHGLLSYVDAEQPDDDPLPIGAI